MGRKHLNGPLTAADITYGSRRKVWWRCAKGHGMARRRRAPGQSRIFQLPICAGKQVCPAKNKFQANLFPKFASQWHREKNGALRPQAGPAPNSNHRVWWRCSLGRVAGRGGCAHVRTAADVLREEEGVTS